MPIFILVGCSSDEDFLLEQSSDYFATRSLDDDFGLRYPMNSFIDTIDLNAPVKERVDFLLNEMQSWYAKGYNPLFRLLKSDHINKIFSKNIILVDSESVGGYDPFSNQIILKPITDVTDLRINIIEEELVHAGQNRIYKNGICQYFGKKGGSNIEFEAKLTVDLIAFVNGGCFDLGAGPNNREQYSKWIIALCGSGLYATFPSMDSVLNVKINGEGYYDMMKAFTKKNPKYDLPILDPFNPYYINFTYQNYGK